MIITSPFMILLIGMSYSFLLKYIIIGDSGTQFLTQESESPACCCSTLTSAIARSTRSPSEYNSEPRCSSSRRTTSSCRFGIQYCFIDSGRTRELQGYHQRILQERNRSSRSLRHLQQGQLHSHRQMAGGSEGKRTAFSHVRACGQQERQTGRVTSISLRRKVTFEEGLRFAKEQGIAFL